MNDYNLKWFANKLKQARQTANLSQNEVSNLTYIHVDTLRRIENGKNPPRLETLKTLSILYKVDLLYLLSECTNKNNYNELFSLIDKEIIESSNQSYNAIKFSIEELKQIQTSDLFLLKQKQQLILLANILLRNLHEITLDELLRCIRISVPKFEIEHYKDNIYNYIELRILLLISLYYTEIENFEFSNEILHFLESYSMKFKPYNIESKKIFLKILSNLSYNYYKIKDDINSLKYAEYGINYSIKYDTFYLLHHFQFRKAIALIFLKKPGHELAINSCFTILRLTNKFDLLNKYKTILTKKYNIDIDLKVEVF